MFMTISRFIFRMSRLRLQLKGILFDRMRFRYFGYRSVLENPAIIVRPDRISIGNATNIRPQVRMEVACVEGSAGTILIGDRCLIEQNVHIVSCRTVKIGNDVTITANCSIVDVAHPLRFDGKALGARIDSSKSFPVDIGNGCFIGTGSTLLPGATLGEGCVVGANSVVNGNFPAFSLLAGSPARVIRNIG